MKKEEIQITKYTDTPDKHYAFISYASANEETVFNDYIIPLHEKYGLNVYFDKDFKLHACENWSDQMYENIQDSSLCIIFISNDYVCSYACILEVLTAINFNIPILKIQLNNPTITESLKEKQISSFTQEAFVEIGEKLNRNGSDYYRFYVDIKKYVEKGVITERRLCKPFLELINNIPGLKLSINDGIDNIISSINNASQNHANVFTSIINKSNNSQEKRKTAEISGVTLKQDYIWGPERPSFTLSNRPNYAVFNSITDNPAVGDERVFVRIAKKNTSTTYQKKIIMEPDKDYEVYIYYHNNASDKTNCEDMKWAGTALKTRLEVSFPTRLYKDECRSVNGIISWEKYSDQGNRLSVFAGAIISTKEDISLHYVTGTAKIYNEKKQGELLSDSIFVRNGILLADEEFDGFIPGESNGHVLFTIRTKKI